MDTVGLNSAELKTITTVLVFGFLYSVYATGMFQATPEHPEPPPITVFLRRFCRILAAILAILTAMSIWTGYRAGVGWETWVIIACFVAVTLYSIELTFRLQ
jgi:hypothetical protein